MGIGGFFVEYQDGNGLKHKLAKYVSTTDESTHWLAGDGTTIDLAAATLPSTNDNAGGMIRAFCKAYEFIASTGSNLLSLSADWRNTGGPGVVDAAATFNWSGFSPAGATAGFGPYPTGFAACRTRASASRRAGWLRIYTTGGTLYTKPTRFTPASIDADFQSWLDLVGSPGAGNGVYVVWSGYSVSTGSWEPLLNYQTSLLRIGAKNG